MKKKILISLAVVIALVYFGGVAIFSFLTYPNTSVNGIDRSYTAKEMLLQHERSNDTYTFTGLYGEELKLKEATIGYTRAVAKDPQIDQNPFAWPLAFFTEHHYTVEYASQYDENRLDFAVKESDFDAQGKLPVDASLKIESGNVEIVPEQPGTRVDPEIVKTRIIQAFDNDVKDVVIDDAYIQPKVTKDNPALVKEYETISKIASVEITYDFDDRTFVLGGEELLGMYDEVDGQYVLNKQKTRDWLRQVAIDTDTYATVRKFQATGLGEVTVPAGIYGWQMNVDKTNDKLQELLAEGKSVTVKPVYNMEGLARTKDDIGGTYVEIDLSRQKIWGYKDGKQILEANVVTGKPTGNTSTPVGTNKIWSKETDRYLRGLRPGTSENYASHVNYWMPIGWTGSGLHDASWRTEFGGDIYIHNGSYSCINLDYDTAKTIYDNFPINTPVVTYESSTSYSEPEFQRQKEIKEEEEKKQQEQEGQQQQEQQQEQQETPQTSQEG